MHKVLFPALKWLFFLFIPLTLYGFFPTYISRIDEGFPPVVHIHAAFMLLWMAMAVVQPLLIHYKKVKWHRFAGKISYVLMPCLFVSLYFMLRYIYYGQLDKLETQAAPGHSALPEAEIASRAAAYMILGLLYFIWLVIFYSLAVINKRKMLYHATYMTGAVMTLLGPSFDRALFFTLEKTGVRPGMIAEYASFTLLILLFGYLLYYQRKKGNSIRPASVSLILILAGIAVYRFLPGTAPWTGFVQLIFP